MEACSQPLATESFSYNWLTNQKPSFDGLNVSLTLTPSFDNYDEAIIKDALHHYHYHHQNQNKNNHQDFDFNILSESKASDSLIHAHDVFVDGCIMPGVNPNLRYEAIISAPATPNFSLASITERRSPCRFLEKLKKSSSRVLKKSFSFLSKLGYSRDDLDRKVKENRRRTGADAVADVAWGEIRHKSKKSDGYKLNRLRNVRSCNNSPWASPPPSPPLFMDPCLHMDCSMNEAILHCKRSYASK